MTQNKSQFAECNDKRMRVAGNIVRELQSRDFKRIYDTNLTISERSTYAQNILSQLLEYRRTCKHNQSNLDLLSGILNVELSDLEIKALSVSKHMTEDEARQYYHNDYIRYF